MTGSLIEVCGGSSVIRYPTPLWQWHEIPGVLFFPSLDTRRIRLPWYYSDHHRIFVSGLDVADSMKICNDEFSVITF